MTTFTEAHTEDGFTFLVNDDTGAVQVIDANDHVHAEYPSDNGTYGVEDAIETFFLSIEDHRPDMESA